MSSEANTKTLSLISEAHFGTTMCRIMAYRKPKVNFRPWEYDPLCCTFLHQRIRTCIYLQIHGLMASMMCRHRWWWVKSKNSPNNNEHQDTEHRTSNTGHYHHHHHEQQHGRTTHPVPGPESTASNDHRGISQHRHHRVLFTTAIAISNSRTLN